MARTRSYRSYESRYALRRTVARETRLHRYMERLSIHNSTGKLMKKSQREKGSPESPSVRDQLFSTPTGGKMQRRVTRGLVASATKPQHVTRSTLQKQGVSLEAAAAASSKVDAAAGELRQIVRNFSLIYSNVLPRAL